jgi:hypothetical protein
MNFVSRTGPAPFFVDPLSEYVKWIEYENRQETSEHDTYANWVEKRETWIAKFRLMLETAAASTS